jgi:predicted chitinase
MASETESRARTAAACWVLAELEDAARQCLELDVASVRLTLEINGGHDGEGTRAMRVATCADLLVGLELWERAHAARVAAEQQAWWQREEEQEAKGRSDG